MPDADVTIRPAAEEDYDEIVRLWAVAGLDARCGGRDRRESFIDQLAHFPTTYLVAESAGHLVGVVLGTHDWRKGWINRLAVHPEYRRRRIARRLVEATERAFVELGIEIFAALVETHNNVSARAFERMQYKRDIPVHYFHKRLRPDV